MRQRGAGRTPAGSGAGASSGGQGRGPGCAAGGSGGDGGDGKGPQGAANDQHYHNFSNKYELLIHFRKHGKEFKGHYKSPEEYLSGANFIIENGHKVQYSYMGKTRTGYVRFMGNTRGRDMNEIIQNMTKHDLDLKKDHKFGEAKFEFLALREDGTIATYHTLSGEKFYKTINGCKKASNINAKLSCPTM